MWKISRVLFFVTIFGVSCEAAKKRMCIVGAGVSGLAAVQYFSEYPDEFEPVVFEKNSDVGGLWIYTDSTTVDEHGLPVHSSMYQSLRTNAVKEMITYPEYQHFGGKKGKGAFVDHEDVLQYLRNYTDHFNLRRYIKFNTNVEQVNPLPGMRWLVVAENLNTKTKTETTCDATVICNGHQFKGYVPVIPGIDKFSGHVLHSHVYRKPEPFVNQTVVILGAGFSGLDISIDISSVAKKVYLSHRHDKIPSPLPSNMEQVPGVVAATGSELILSNGTKLRADSLVYCTGYVYDFPFLDERSGIVVEGGKYVHSLYKHLINIERPTMAIANVLKPGLYFLTTHSQMKYFRATLRGEMILPSREEMLLESQLPPDVPISQAHLLYYKDFITYMDNLALAIGDPPLPWWLDPTAGAILQLIFSNPTSFREKKLIIHEDERRVEFV